MRQPFTYSYGHYGDIDDLELEYDGNQLRTATGKTGKVRSLVKTIFQN